MRVLPAGTFASGITAESSWCFCFSSGTVSAPGSHCWVWRTVSHLNAAIPNALGAVVLRGQGRQVEHLCHTVSCFLRTVLSSHSQVISRSPFQMILRRGWGQGLQEDYLHNAEWEAWRSECPQAPEFVDMLTTLLSTSSLYKSWCGSSGTCRCSRKNPITRAARALSSSERQQQILPRGPEPTCKAVVLQGWKPQPDKWGAAGGHCREPLLCSGTNFRDEVRKRARWQGYAVQELSIKIYAFLACNPNTWVAEAEGTQVGGHSGLYARPCLKKPKIYALWKKKEKSHEKY